MGCSSWRFCCYRWRSTRSRCPAFSFWSEFLATAGTLTLAERRSIVEQALVLLEQNYVHLPLKVGHARGQPGAAAAGAAGAHGPPDRTQTMEPEWMFHRRCPGIFHSVRDLHTNYLLPAPFAGQDRVPAVPIEKCSPRAAASTTWSPGSSPGSAPRSSGRGRGHALERYADRPGRGDQRRRFAGSNQAANLARGLDSLTLRPLVSSCRRTRTG